MVCRIKSLPFDANQLDIIQFFEGFRLKPNGVQLVVRSDNKPTGEVSCQRTICLCLSYIGCNSRENPSFLVPILFCLHLDHSNMRQQCFVVHACDENAGGPLPAQSNSAQHHSQPLISLVYLVLHVQAFVDFESAEEAGRAIRDKDHKVFNEKFGERFVRLIQVRSLSLSLPL